MHRRSLLALVAAGAATGCVGRFPPGLGPNGTGSPTPTAGPRTVPMGGAVTLRGHRFRVADARLQETVVHWDTFYTLHARERGQYLVADVAVDGKTLTGDDALFSVVENDTALVVDGDEYRPDDALTGRGQVVFPVPATPADRAWIRVRAGDRTYRWDLDAATAGAMDRVPEFAVRDAAGETDGDRPALALTVENAGDRDGTFRALVCLYDAADGCELVAFEVPRGETVTHRVPMGECAGCDLVLPEGWSADSRRFGVGFVKPDDGDPTRFYDAVSVFRFDGYEDRR